MAAGPLTIHKTTQKIGKCCIRLGDVMSRIDFN